MTREMTEAEKKEHSEEVMSWLAERVALFYVLFCGVILTLHFCGVLNLEDIPPLR